MARASSYTVRHSLPECVSAKLGLDQLKGRNAPRGACVRDRWTL